MERWKSCEAGHAVKCFLLGLAGRYHLLLVRCLCAHHCHCQPQRPSSSWLPFPCFFFPGGEQCLFV